MNHDSRPETRAATAGTLQAAAVGVATELAIGRHDQAVITALVDELPDEALPLLALLVDTLGDIARLAGVTALRRAGLHAAQLATQVPR
ncbi:hypothetical protein COO58_17610 [Micromonospora sp. WMMA1996]|uniref:hypothetical protein n=1 Tax=Micromonospora sp. WMMA1996 TaxID=2039878 RepID=UPI000BF8AF34|nr:hypothetical protein [Micromonospora sp. WMMA1996]PGH46025.1 hypothetical protein COO58_17610 [Micromonospora sp. WMMA1996]